MELRGSFRNRTKTESAVQGASFQKQKQKEKSNNLVLAYLRRVSSPNEKLTHLNEFIHKSPTQHPKYLCKRLNY
jgi:hypothetical protein